MKQKLKQKKHAINRKPQHVNIDIKHKALVPTDDEIPPLPPNIKTASSRSYDNSTIKISLSRE